MRNGFHGFCLLMGLLRKAHIKVLERLLMFRIKILAKVSEGNIGESHVSRINCYFCQEYLKFHMFRNEIIHNSMYIFLHDE